MSFYSHSSKAMINFLSSRFDESLNKVQDFQQMSSCILNFQFYCNFCLLILGQNESGIFPCPRGFYCPAGTGNDHRPCPLGTFSSNLGLKEERECTPCTAGRYCPALNMTAATAQCNPGYYCVSGSHTATPQLTNLTHCPASFSHLSIGGKCPRGSFCPQGSPTYNGKSGIFSFEIRFYIEPVPRCRMFISINQYIK